MSPWECGLCTFINQHDVPRCGICESARTEPVQSIDADHELAKRLQQQYLEEEKTHETTPTNTNNPSTSTSNTNTNNATPTTNTSSQRPTARSKKRKRKRHEMEVDASSDYEQEEEEYGLIFNDTARYRIKQTNVAYCYSTNDIISKTAQDWFPGGGKSNERENPYLTGKINIICSRIDEALSGGNPIESIFCPMRKYTKPGDSKTYRYDDCGIGLRPDHTSTNPYVILDFKTTKIAPSSFGIARGSPLSHHNDEILGWAFEGSNDMKSWTMLAAGKRLYWNGNVESFHNKEIENVFYSKVRFRLTELNASGRRVLRIRSIRVFGDVQRRAYQLKKRVGHITDYQFYSAIPKDRCIGDINNVFHILNENDDIKHDECEPYNAPIPQLNVQLKGYQKKGLTWLLDRENTENEDVVRGGLLCDEMGLGKTVQIIALMLVQKQKNPNERTLIITPLSLIDQWIAELSKIADPKAFKVLNYYGQQRKKLKKPDFTRCNVVLSTTDTFKKAMGKTRKMWDDYADEMWMKAEKQELLFKLNKGFFDRIVVDESHEIKKIDTVRSKAICTMASRCKYKWCLTGTPVHNDITYDLGGACRFLGIKHATYVEKFKLTDKEKDSELKLKPKFSKQKKKSMWLDVSNEFCLNRIKTFIKPIMLRRTKKYVLANDFPEKEEIIVKCALSEEERVIYNKNYDEAKKQYAQFKTTKNVMSRYVHLLGMLTKLRKICTHPCMVFNRASLLDQEGNTNVMDFASTTDVLDRMHEDIVRRINEMSSLIEYECPICFELTELNGVVLSNCGHVFCRDCCEELERQLCPICRGRFTSRDMVRIEHVLKSKQLDEKHKEEFETYKVHGIEKKSGDEGADEEIDYGKYDELLEKYCDPMCASSKINALMERLEYIEQHHNGDKVLVFSNFTHCFKIIGQTLKDKDIEYIKFDSSLSRKQRAKTLDYFNKSEECKVLLISARCASVGLNLMCANHVIFVDPRVNPGLDNQAIGRCWRIGQNKTVYVSRLIMENTIEEKILSMQQGKDSTEDTELVNLKQKSRLNERDYDELFDYKSNGNSNSNSNS
eukprot:61100_1